MDNKQINNKPMNKIEELILKYCPNGVEFKPLGEVCKVGTGSNNSEDANENGIFPFYVRSNNIKKINCYEFDEESIIIPGEGGIGEIFHYINGKYSLHQRAYRINFIDHKISTKFIYYYMIVNFKKFIMMKSANATVQSIRKPMIETFKIPIPPIEIQQEIVNILDKFTKLEAELELRQKQYNYYRDNLLNFNPTTTTFKPLGEVFNLRNGYTPSKQVKDYWENGNIPWFRMDDIRTNGRILHSSLQTITQEAIKSSYLFPANSIIMSTTATIGEHALITTPFLANQRFTCMFLKDEYKALMDIKFIFYWCFLLSNWCCNNVSTSSFASVNMTEFKKIKIPIPPIEIQQEIVNILDKFDSLVNNISTGLPAEIKARKQQYEYYRNQLLNFKELKHDL